MTAGLASSLAGDGIEVEDGAPFPTAAPANEAQVVQVVQRAARDGLRILPMGLGTKLSFCRPEAAEGGFDLALSLRRMRDVTAYEPGDGTLTAQVGARMEDLARTVLTGGHRLTPDAPNPDHSTLGGVIGAGLSGPDRLRFGPVRHHVLGMRVVRADGSVSKSGGRLVKNVTGFDLHRLYCGSRGTLCVFLEASLRLFPEPERELAVSNRYSGPREALEAFRGLRELQLTPLAVTIENVLADDYGLHVFLAGRAEQVEWELGEVRGVLGELQTLEGEDARKRRAEVRDLTRGDGWPALRMLCLPSQVPSAIESANDFARARNAAPRFVVQPGVATVDVFLGEDVGVEFARDLRELLEPAEIDLEPWAAPAAVHAALAPTDDVPGVAWMLRLRDTLDPAGTFASPFFPGRA